MARCRPKFRVHSPHILREREVQLGYQPFHFLPKGVFPSREASCSPRRIYGSTNRCTITLPTDRRSCECSDRGGRA